MTVNIQRITGTSAKIAARFRNFVTAQSFLLPDHINFLDDEVAPVIRGMKGAWVDIFGYASRRSDANFNQRLSEQRIFSVKNRISEYANQVNFQFSVPLGESESGPDETTNANLLKN